MMRNRDGCTFKLHVEKANYHPGGTALRVETTTPLDRCALKPKMDNFGRRHEPLRWVASGGDAVTVAHPCSGNCPLRVLADVGAYGSSYTAPCPLCRRVNRLPAAGVCVCRECGTEFEMVGAA